MKPHVTTFCRIIKPADLKNPKIGLNAQVIIREIDLKEVTALELFRLCSEDIKTIFITRQARLPFQVMCNQHLDFLPHHPGKQAIVQCLERFIPVFSSKSENSVDENIHIRDRGITRVLQYAEIIYLEADGPYSTFHTENDQFKTARTLKSIMEELNESFVRIHKTYAINKKYIIGYHKDEVLLVKDLKLPLSRNGKRALATK